MSWFRNNSLRKIFELIIHLFTNLNRDNRLLTESVLVCVFVLTKTFLTKASCLIFQIRNKFKERV